MAGKPGEEASAEQVAEIAALKAVQAAVNALSVIPLVMEPFIPTVLLSGDGMNTASALSEGAKAAKQVLLDMLVMTGHMRKEPRKN